MDQRRDLNRYTLARVQWMLENYNALDSRRPMTAEDKQVMAGVVTSHSQWWNAKRYWDKIAKKSDLDSAIDWATKQDTRKRTIIDLRYRFQCYPLPWDDIGDAIGVQRMQVWRLHNQTLRDIIWYLGEVSDT